MALNSFSVALPCPLFYISDASVLRSRMIIWDAGDQQPTKEDLFVAGLTLRSPEKAVARSDSPLPDYETSEARHKYSLHDSPSRKALGLDVKHWRVIFYALIVYIILSATIGVPIILLVRFPFCLPPHVIYHQNCRKRTKCLTSTRLSLPFGTTMTT